MRFSSGTSKSGCQGDVHLCGVVFSGTQAFSAIRFSGMSLNSYFENCQVLKPADTLAPIQPSRGLHWSLANLCCRGSLIYYLGTFLQAVGSFGLILEEPMQLLLAPEFVTFPEFLLHSLLSQTQIPKAHANSTQMPGRYIPSWAV